MCDFELSPVPGDGPQRDLACAAEVDGTVFVFGGRDAAGAAATPVLLALDLADAGGSWRAVTVAGGKQPAPRWGASCFSWGSMLWVAGGTGGGGKALDDVWRFDPLTRSWAEAGRDPRKGGGGERPRRGAWGAGATADGFDRCALAGGTLLAFGEPQDENRDPSRRAAPVAGPLALHALDLCGGVWRQLSAGGTPGFGHLEALAVAGGRLVAVGWTAPRANRRDDVAMQVATLDVASALTPGCDRPASWSKLHTHGHVPTARTGCAAALLQGGGGGAGCCLLLHAGMLCSPSVQGLLTSDAYALDLDACCWTKLAPQARRAFGLAPAGQPRMHHSAAALPRGAGALLIGGTTSLTCFASCSTAELLHRAAPAAPWPAPVFVGVAAAPPLTASPTTAERVAPFAPAVAAAGPHDPRPFFLSESLSDVVLVAGDARFPAHRLVLAASPRFCQMMEQAAADDRPSERRWKVHVTDIWPDILKLLLAHMYGCLDAAPAADAATLFGAATRYGLPALRAECRRVLCATTSVESVATHVLLAYEHGCPDLMQACVSFAAASQERLAQMLASPGYLHLTEASPKVGQAFLTQAMAELLRK